jgi:hypothetical protein
MQKGDKLGMFVGTAPSSIVYTFDFTDPSTLFYQYPSQSDVPALGDIISFDPLRQSYKMSAYATVDIGN